MRRVLQQWKAEALCRSKVPCFRDAGRISQLSVIHDLNFEHRPKTCPPSGLAFTGPTFNYARQATLLGTVSIQPPRLGVDVRVGCQGHSSVSQRGRRLLVPPPRMAASSPSACSLRGPRISYVGSLHPRKNIDGLLTAFQHYVDVEAVGRSLWGWPCGRTTCLPCRRRCSDARTLRVASTMAIWWPQLPAPQLGICSRFEGFGIPLVEAMSCGVPVVASNVTSLPEVCGDAAFALVDPGQPEDISKAMLDLEGHPEAASEAAERGLRRPKIFHGARRARP